MQRETITIDANQVRLGKLATEIANALMGKDDPNFEYHQDAGKKVIVYNTDYVSIHPRKYRQKMYYWHTRYPGGIRSKSITDLMEEDSCQVIQKAVYGMLPKNKLRDQMITRLELHQQALS
jgi:large subunit ribosomal protein L13